MRIQRHETLQHIRTFVSQLKLKCIAKDSVWAITLLAEPANVTFEVYAYTDTPSSSNDNIISSQTFSVQAGLTKLAMPIGFSRWGWGWGGTEFECSRVASLDTYVPSFLICSLLVVLVTVLRLFRLFRYQLCLRHRTRLRPSHSPTTPSFRSRYIHLSPLPPTPWITTSSTYPVTPTFDYAVITAGNQTTLRGKNIVVDDMDVYSDDPSGTGNGGTGGLGHVLQYKGNWGVLSPETNVDLLVSHIPVPHPLPSSTSSINDGNITLSYTLDSNSPINLTLPLTSNSDTPIPLSKSWNWSLTLCIRGKDQWEIHTLEVMIAEIRYTGDDTSEGASGSG
ncbi:hypothetical protein D9758_019080 [Tetrapyrgos nigripes]|uniref:Uncharacterized protein n=1 Tax=Tetrapyrgos nigripes TaxID=182062 RepID=A0A8H5AQU9_9AGAR|nr:hypothetical protein D9758_019080 [Tetrapyrgos nigripes]